MYVRNLLKPGDYFIPVPAGIPVELEYNAKGVLCDVNYFDKYENSSLVVDHKIPDAVKSWILSHEIVPKKISLQGGTTRVHGVFCGDLSSVEGPVPDCFFKTTWSAMTEEKVATISFYAYHVVSYATAFIGAYPTLRWLEMSKFKTLRGQIVSVSLPTDEKILHMMFSKLMPASCGIQIPAICAVYRANEFYQYHCRNYQAVVSSTSVNSDPAGRFWLSIVSKETKTFFIDYTLAVKYNIQKNDVIILDEDNEVVYKYPSTSKTKLTLTCPTCGAPLDSSISGRTVCSDPCCNSSLYMRSVYFLKTLGLPTLSYNRFVDELRANHINSILDLFSLPELEETVVHTTLSMLIKSLVGHLNETQEHALYTFLNRCNNNLTSVNYYLQSKENVVHRPDVYVPGIEKVVEWFEVDENWAIFKALTESKHIVLESISKKFEGSPIFRGNTILITGDFIHGTSDEVESILNSYSATVVREYTEDVTFVIVGSCLSHVNGGYLQKAKKDNKPIYDEIEFFKAHEIDEDLRANLL